MNRYVCCRHQDGFVCQNMDTKEIVLMSETQLLKCKLCGDEFKEMECYRKGKASNFIFASWNEVGKGDTFSSQDVFFVDKNNIIVRFSNEVIDSHTCYAHLDIFKDGKPYRFPIKIDSNLVLGSHFISKAFCEIDFCVTTSYIEENGINYICCEEKSKNWVDVNATDTDGEFDVLGISYRIVNGCLRSMVCDSNLGMHERS